MRRFLLCALALLLLSACATGNATESQGDFVAGDGSMRAFAPDEREPAPEVGGETLDGEPLALADLDGIVVVNFWASWCGPCATETPHLAAISQEYADQGVSVLGVNVKDARANAQSFEREFSVPYPSLYDEAAAIAASFGGIGPAALPSTIILDEQHRVAVRAFGAVTAAQLSVVIEGLVEEAG
jgi:thiol-disulfide isomerase/thioredoxin